MEIEHLQFKSLVPPNFTYYISLYGALEPDLNIIQHFCVTYTKCIATIWHHLIYLFIYLFVHESREPVTWSSVVAILVVSVVSSNFFFRRSFRELVLLTEANTPRPGLCYKCSLCKIFYALKRQHLSTCLNLRYGLYNTGRSHCTKSA